MGDVAIVLPPKYWKSQHDEQVRRKRYVQGLYEQERALNRDQRATIAQLEHERDLLAEKLVKVLSAIGGANEDRPYTGPELLMLADDAIAYFSERQSPKPNAEPEATPRSFEAYFGDKHWTVNIPQDEMTEADEERTFTLRRANGDVVEGTCKITSTGRCHSFVDADDRAITSQDGDQMVVHQ